MKFGDKLILLRKKKGLSQEDLAEKLGVSRQSVSKWESNNTYPETDKIIQICNIFDCSMDDLINDKVTDINQASRKNKINWNDTKESFLDFITKTINMFSQMNFTTGFKCLLEMAIIAFCLYILGLFLCNTASHIFGSIFIFINSTIAFRIESITKFILYLLWYLISIIILIHVFKIKYLNQYETNINIVTTKEQKEKDNSDNTTKNEEVKSNEKTFKVDNSKSFEFLKVLANILIWIIKIIIAWILIGFAIGIVAMIVLSILSLTLVPIHILFLGAFLSLLGITIINTEILTAGVCFIGNKKINIKIFIIILIGSLLLCGVGIAETIVSAKNIKLIEDDNYYTKLEEQKLNLVYENDLVIVKEGDGRIDSYDYIIDNTMQDNDIEIITQIDPRYLKLEIDTYQTLDMDQMKEIRIRETFNGNFKELFKLIKEDLKKNQLHIQTEYNDYSETTTIKANETTIQKLVENLKKLYLVEEQKDENTWHIELRDDKVYFPNGIDGYYDAREDNVHLNDIENYECIRSITETEWGDKIIYNCHYKEEIEE